MAESEIRILVIDDEEIVRETLALALSRKGYQVDSAGSAEEAFEKIKEQHYDVHVSDIRMPVESGLDLLDRVKKIKIDANFIMITAHGDEMTAIESLNKGAYAYLKKPVSIRELIIFVERCLEFNSLIKNRQNFEGILFAVRNFEDKINNPLFSITLNIDYLKKHYLDVLEKEFPDSKEILEKLETIQNSAMQISKHINELRQIKDVKILESPVGKMLDL